MPRDLARPIEPRAALLLTLAFLVAVVATPLDAWPWLTFEAVILLIAILRLRVPPRALLRRWLTAIVLVGFLALPVAATHPRRPELGLPALAGAILFKNALAVGSLAVLAGVVPFPALLNGLARLGLPAALVGTLHFLYRYLHVLADELRRMALARRARTFRHRGRVEWPRLGSLVGALLVRSLERGERVHAAMIARGWDGTLHHLDASENRPETDRDRA
jgi:cobalt/nickel transport system permease protein